MGLSTLLLVILWPETRNPGGSSAPQVDVVLVLTLFCLFFERLDGFDWSSFCYNWSVLTREMLLRKQRVAVAHVVVVVVVVGLGLVWKIIAVQSLRSSLVVSPHVDIVGLVSSVVPLAALLALEVLLEHLVLAICVAGGILQGFLVDLGVLLRLVVPHIILACSVQGRVSLELVEGLVSNMSLVHPVTTSLLSSFRLCQSSPRFKSQKNLLVRNFLRLHSPADAVILDPTRSSMPVSMLVTMMAMLVTLMAVQLTRQREVGLVALHLVSLVTPRWLLAHNLQPRGVLPHHRLLRHCLLVRQGAHHLRKGRWPLGDRSRLFSWLDK